MRPFLISLLIVFLTGTALSQRSEVDSLLKAAEKAFSDGNYDKAELGVRRVLDRRPLSTADRIASERLIATFLIAQGKIQPAKTHFIAILKMNPSFELDPLLTSPKILSVFTEAKNEFARQGNAYALPEENRDPAGSSITYRALLFPGWEQIHRGQVGKGLAFASIGAASLGTALASEFLRSSARKDYLSATTPDDINAKYRVYNRYYHIETYSLIVFALTYTASEIDLFTSNNLTLETTSVLGLNESATLTFRIHF